MKDIISRFENSNELGDLQMLLSWLQKWAIQERDHCSNTISDKDKLIKNDQLCCALYTKVSIIQCAERGA
jgi:hypothetical protein